MYVCFLGFFPPDTLLSYQDTTTRYTTVSSGEAFLSAVCCCLVVVVVVSSGGKRPVDSARVQSGCSMLPYSRQDQPSSSHIYVDCGSPSHWLGPGLRAAPRPAAQPFCSCEWTSSGCCGGVTAAHGRDLSISMFRCPSIPVWVRWGIVYAFKMAAETAFGLEWCWINAVTLHYITSHYITLPQQHQMPKELPVS